MRPHNHFRCIESSQDPWPLDTSRVVACDITCFVTEVASRKAANSNRPNAADWLMAIKVLQDIHIQLKGYVLHPATMYAIPVADNFGHVHDESRITGTHAGRLYGYPSR